jgi:hypothetical protein
MSEIIAFIYGIAVGSMIWIIADVVKGGKKHNNGNIQETKHG